MPQVVPFLTAVGKVVTFGKVAGATALAVIGATTIVGASFAVSRLLRPKMDMDIGDTDGSRQRTVRSTIEPQKLVYGETMVSGPLTYAQVSGDNNRYLHQVIALAGHELTEIKEVYFDDKSIDLTDSSVYNSSTKHVIGGFFGPEENENGVSETIVYIDTRLGAATQTAYAGLRSDTTTQSEYLATHRGDGIASLYTKWTLHEGSREVWDEVGSVQSIKAVVKGKKVYDPRLDVNAGNTAGANPTNASYVVYSDNSLSTGSAVGNYDRSNQGQNPALILADYLMNSRFGLGIPSSKIDWSAVVAAADHCDQLVPVPSSATQKRFFGSGVIFGGDKHRRSIEKILSAMNGSLVYTSGKYVIRAGVYFAVSETLTESDVIGPVQVQTSIPRSDRFNQVKGLFIDPSENYKMMEFGPVTTGASDFNSQPVGAIARDNGEVLTEEVKLPFTSNRYAAQRLALLQVAQSYHQTVVTVPVNLKGMRIAIGDRVNLTIDALNEVDSGSWSPKIFKCIGWSFSESDSGGIDLTLIEDFSASYNNPQESDYSTITAAGVISTGLPDVPSPTGFTATAGINRVELNWTNPPNTGAWEQIWVYASASSTTPTDSSTPIAKFRGTSFTHMLDGGTNNYYWIQAVRYPNGTTPGSGQTNAAKSAFIPSSPTNVTANKITTAVIGDGQVDTTQIANDAIDSDKIDTIQSSNYSNSAGSEAGWKIDQDGSAEFNNVVVRGNVNATTGTIGGLTVGSDKIYVGTGTHNNSNTAFYVDDQGQFSLKDKLVWTGSALTIDGGGTFSGALSAATGSFTGTLSGGTISGGTISIGSNNDIFKADSNGIYLGNATFGSAPFRVTPAGAITSTSGTIGGFTLASNKLSAGADATTVSMSTADGIHLGATAFGSAPFRVSRAGALTATNATITGAVTATSGTFTGTVNASAGAFTGDVSTDSKFTAGSSDDVAVVDGSDVLYRFYAGDASAENAAFRVDKDGHIDARDIRIYDENGQVILDATGLHGSGLGDISANAGVGVAEVAGRLDNNTDEITFTTGTASEAYTFETKVQIDINQDAGSGESPTTSNLSFAGADQSAVTTIIGQVKLIVEYFVKVSGGSYSATPTATDEFTFVSGTSASASQLGVNVLTLGSRGAGLIYANLGAAEAIADPSISGARTFVKSTKNITFSTAATHVIKVNARIATTAGTTLTTSTTPALDASVTTGTGVILGSDETQSSLEDFRRLYTIKPASGNTKTIIASTTDDTFSSTGGSSLLTSGGTISGNLTVTGDFTVQGTTTTLDTATLNVEDKNITVNYATGDSSGSADGAGITIQDAVDASTDATILWDQTNSEFDFSHGATFAGGITFSGDIFGTNSSSNLVIGNSASGNIYLGGGNTNTSNIYFQTGSSVALTLDSSNNATFAGTISSGAITSSGNITATNQININSSSYDNRQIGMDSNGFFIYNAADSRYDLKISDSGVATFGGKILASEQSVFTGNAISGTPNSNAQIVAADSGVAGIAIHSNDGGQSYIWFGDNTNNAVGRIYYSHSADKVFWRVGGTNDVHTLDSSGNATFSGNVTSSGYLQANGHISTGSNSGRLRAGLSNEVEISFNGSHAEIDVDTGNLTIDVAGEIILDSDAEFVRIYHDGGWVGGFQLTNNDFIIRSAVQDKDIIFKGYDGTSLVTALTLDMSAAGAATFNSQVTIPTIAYVGQSIVHQGDSDTSIDFAGANDLRIYAAGLEHATFDGTIVFNQGGADMDLRVESSGNQNMLMVDAGNDRVAIGHNSPDGIFHVKTASSVQRSRFESGSSHSFVRVIGSTGSNAGLEFFSGSGNVGNITADSSSNLLFEPGGTEKMRLSSGGTLHLNNYTASNAKLRAQQTTNSEWVANFINYTAAAYGVSIDTSSATTSSTYNFAAYTPSGTGFFLNNYGVASLGTTMYDSTNTGLQLMGRGIAIKNDRNGSNNNWTRIQNRATGSASNLYFGLGSGNIEFTHGGTIVTNPVANYHHNFNDNQADSDFRVASTSKTHALWVNAGDNYVNVGNAVGRQTIANLNVRENGAAIEFGHQNNTSGYYGTLGAYGNNGMPYIGFSTYSEASANTFTTNGFAGNIIVSDQGTLQFNQVTNSSATGQTPVRRMTLDTSGNFLVGKTAVNTFNEGFVAKAAGGANITAAGATVLDLNRRSSNGTILNFRYDNTTVGFLQTRANVVSTLVLDPRSGGAGLTAAGASLFPTNESGTVSNGAIDLGYSVSGTNYRFRNLYLQGGGIVSDHGATGYNVLTAGGSTQTQYTNLELRSNNGTGQIWKAGTAYSNWGGASSFNVYSSTGPIAFHPNQVANAFVLGTSGQISHKIAGNILDGTYYSGFTMNITGTNTFGGMRFDRNGSAKFRVGLRDDSKFQIANFSASSYFPVDDQFVIHADGNVSIGNDVASNGLLSIHGNKSSAGDLWTQVGPNNNASLILRNTSATNNTNAAIYFGNNSGVYAAINARFVDQTSEHTELRFSTTNTSGTSRERAVLNGSGYLGVGRTTAYYGLDLTAPGNNLARLLSSSGDALVRIIANNYATESDARLFLGEADTYGMTFEYDGVANIGYIGMNDNVDPTGSYSRRIQFPRTNTHTSFMAGNVGISTTGPLAKLHVSGNEVFLQGGNTTTGPGIFLGDSNFANSSYYNSAPGIGSVGPYGSVTAGLGFYYYAGAQNSRSEAGRIDSNGAWLIGTTDDSVYNNSGSGTGINLQPFGNIAVARDGNDCMVLNRLNSSGNILNLAYNGATVGSIGTIFSDLYIGTGDTAIRFDDGNNAITPRGADGAARDAAIDIGTSSVRFRHQSLSGGVYVGNGSASAPTMTFDSDTDTGFYRYSAGKISMTGNGTESMRMSSFGLDMTMNSSAYVDLNRSGFITFYGTGSNQHGIGSRDYAGTASDDIRINSFGSVNINLDANNDNTSAANFYIGKHGAGAGSMTIITEVNGENGNITTTGNVTAYGSPSDIRLKENIETIPNALDKVQKLQGVTFNYKKDGSRSTGLIAQELQEVLPEAVYEATEIASDEKFLAVRYGNTVGLLVEAIKEQQQTIDALIERITKLEKKNGSDKDK